MQNQSYFYVLPAVFLFLVACAGQPTASEKTRLPNHDGAPAAQAVVCRFSTHKSQLGLKEKATSLRLVFSETRSCDPVSEQLDVRPLNPFSACGYEQSNPEKKKGPQGKIGSFEFGIDSFSYGAESILVKARDLSSSQIDVKTKEKTYSWFSAHLENSRAADLDTYERKTYTFSNRDGSNSLQISCSFE